MRVTELAKQLKIPAPVVLAQAKKMGLDVTVTFSKFSDSDLEKIQAYYAALKPEELTEQVTAFESAKADRKTKEATLTQNAAAKNAEAIAAHRAVAKQAEAAARGVEVPAEPAPAQKPEPTATTASAPSTEAPKVETPVAEPIKPTTAQAEPSKVPVDIAPVTQEKAPVAPTAPAVATTPAAKSTPAPATKPVASAPEVKKSATPKKPIRVVDDEDDETAELVPPEKTTSKQGQNKPHGGRDFEQRNNNRNPYGKNAQGRGRQQQQAAPAPSSGPAVAIHGKTIQVRGAVTVKELAELLGMRPNLLIADLMRLNVLASINQRLDSDVTIKIAAKYGFTIEEQQSKRSAERKPVLKTLDADDDIPQDKPEDMILRPPVVTFLGHVDHGKTTLIDHIRNTRVAAGEAGGITQHIGAYTITVQGDRRITFIDTPGHAAFSAMRARGANLTDIAVIVVAADDGVMPQTREAISHARQAGVQMLVAINKCDKPEARPDRVRQMLQGEGLTPEEWGGDIVCCEVSGITGAGIDNLLDMILLQADVLELQANPNRRANGAVIESQLEQGLGPTATMLVQGGTLNVGDVILCDEHYGKVRALIDERGERVQSAGPSIAVKCTGLSGVPDAGSTFRVMLSEKRARELAEKAAEENKQSSLSQAQAASMADWTSRLGDGNKGELGVIVKADTQGTAEAVAETLKTLKSDKVTMKLLYIGVGSIAPTDVQRAGSDNGSIIVGFNVSCEPGVQTQARHNGVRISTFRIIYELLEHVKRCMLDLIAPEYKEVVRGHAEIRQIFDIGKLGKIAGCQLLDGSLRKKAKFRIYHNKEVIFDGALQTMRHFKDEVTEVTGAQECGLGFGNFERFQEGDTIECYEMEELPKTL